MTDNTVDDLRSITEEADLGTFLKPTVGGYTKKSVLEYLAYLKKQQQDAKDAYTEELSRLQAEKERLAQENKTLDDDLKEAVERITKDEAELEQSNKELTALRDKAEKSSKKAEELGVLYEEASSKNEELTAALAEISSEQQKMPRRAAEIKLPTSKETADADEKMQALIKNTEDLQAEMAARTAALGEQMLTLDALYREQISTCREAVATMRGELREQLDQNALLESERDGLTKRVGEVLEQNLFFEKENTRLKAENVLLQRRLEMQ